MSKNKNILSDEKLQEAMTLVQSGPEEQDLVSQLPMADYNHLPDFSEEMLFTWVAPDRVFKPRKSNIYKRNLVLLLSLIVLLLIFTNQFALLIVVLALIFLAYVLSVVPPRKIRHVITNYGIYTHDKFYPWLDRGKRYWWEENHGQKQIVMETKIFPYRLIMLIGHPRNEKQIEEVVKHYLIKQKPEANDVDKMIKWWREKFPLE